MKIFDNMQIRTINHCEATGVFTWEIYAKWSYRNTGTLEEKDAIFQKAKEALAYSVYDEIKDDLIKLKMMLFREDFMDKANPILKHIEGMIEKMTP